MASLPIRFSELVQLTSLGIDAAAIGFNSCVSTLLRILCCPGGLAGQAARRRCPVELGSRLQQLTCPIVVCRHSSRIPTSAYKKRRTPSPKWSSSTSRTATMCRDAP